MNNSQLKYVRDRAQTIYRDKQSEIRDQYVVKGVTLEQALEAFETGKFTVREPLERYSKMSWANWISFDEAPLPDLDERDKRLTALTKEYTKLMDELILGDNQKALELLKAFENNE